MDQKKIRVLYVAENRSFGGSERGFSQLLTGLDPDRFQPYVAAHPGGQLGEAVRQAEVPFLPLDMARRLNLRDIGRLREFIRQNRIDVVHSMGSRADFTTRMAGRNLPSTAIVCTFAMFVEGYDVGRLRKSVYRLADRWSSKYVTRFIAVSGAIKKKLIEERGITADRITVVHNGVEFDKYDPGLYEPADSRRSLGIPNDRKVVGTVGRLVFQKGYRYLLEAAQKVLSKDEQVIFVIVGSGEEEERLKSLAQSLGISEACAFVGPRFDIANVMSAFEIFVLSSVLEGLPRTVIEAMAMARPIVATDIDGVREELRHEETGILVPPADSGSLAEAILMLLADREKAMRLGQAARRDAEQRFDIRLTLSKIETLYEDVLHGNSTA